MTSCRVGISGGGVLIEYGGAVHVWPQVANYGLCVFVCVQ